MKKIYIFDFEKFNNENWEDIEDIYESVIYWDLNIDDYFYDEYYKDKAFDQVQKHLKDLTSKEIANNEDKIHKDIKSAMRSTIEANYADDLYQYLKDEIQEMMLNSSNNVQIDKVDFEYEETNETNSGYKTIVKVTISEEEWKKQKENYKEDVSDKRTCTNHCVNEYIEEGIYADIVKVNTEHFDYYGTKKRNDGWFQYYIESEETSYKIIKARKKMIEKRKQQIKKHVPLQYRKAII